MAIEFIRKIIENLQENSFIFLPILQVNSGFSNNLENVKEDIFGLSMININMIKNHLNSLIPNIIFIIKHPTIKSKRGSLDKKTGTVFIYEEAIFYNNIGEKIDNILKKRTKDAAVIIAFVFLHEIFMHKKLRTNTDFIYGKETPAKFIGPKYNIQYFYYTNEKKNTDFLSIYSPDKKLDKIQALEGECGHLFEYFFQNGSFKISEYLKKHIGFGELFDNVQLLTSNNINDLQKFIEKKLKDPNVRKLLTKNSKKKSKKEIDEDIIMEEGSDNESEEKDREGKEEEEEEEEEEEDDEEMSEETKNIINLEEN